MSPDVIQHEVKLPNETSVFVHKDDEVFFFEGRTLNMVHSFYTLYFVPEVRL